MGREGTTDRDVDDVDNVVCELSRIICGEIVSTALNEEHLAAIFSLESLEGPHIRADVFSDRGVRASTSLDGEDTRWWEGLVCDQEFLILPGEDVICHSG